MRIQLHDLRMTEVEVDYIDNIFDVALDKEWYAIHTFPKVMTKDIEYMTYMYTGVNARQLWEQDVRRLNEYIRSR